MTEINATHKMNGRIWREGAYVLAGCDEHGCIALDARTATDAAVALARHYERDHAIREA